MDPPRSRTRPPPYLDQTPLRVPGTPEVREYRALGVMADQAIGHPSDVISVAFAG